MTRRGIACAGNWILDIVHDIPTWPEKSDLVRITAQKSGLGGGPANVAAGLVAMWGVRDLTRTGLAVSLILGPTVLRFMAEGLLDRRPMVFLFGASGVVLWVSSFRPAYWTPLVPIYPAGMPLSSSRRRVRIATDVFPLVPVMPIRCMSRSGWQ